MSRFWGNICLCLLFWGGHASVQAVPDPQLASIDTAWSASYNQGILNEENTPCEEGLEILGTLTERHFRKLRSDREMADRLNRAAKQLAVFLPRLDMEKYPKLRDFLANENPVEISDRGTEISCDFPRAISLSTAYAYSTREIWDAWINAFLMEMDPHSRILSHKNARRLWEQSQGNRGSLGIEFVKTDQGITVVDVYEDSPADVSRVQPGDRITHLGTYQNMTSVQDLNESQLTDLLHGTPGESIEIRILNGEGRPYSFSITYEKIPIRFVRSRILDQNVLHLRVFQFGGGVADQIRDEIEKHPNHKGLILDLRWNPGGNYQETGKVADLFIDRGPVASAWNREGRPDLNLVERAITPGQITYAPMIILINEKTASAAELIAQVLSPSDYGRAMVVGSGPTYGKGSVTSIYPLQKGRVLAFTEYMFFTAGGHSPQLQGVSPSFIVGDPVMDRLIDMRKTHGLENPLREAGFTYALPAPHPLNPSEQEWVGEVIIPAPIRDFLSRIRGNSLFSFSHTPKDHGAELSRRLAVEMHDFCQNFQIDGCHVDSALASNLAKRPSK